MRCILLLILILSAPAFILTGQTPTLTIACSDRAFPPFLLSDGTLDSLINDH